ncbi:hypothetical protein H4582DRAFT_2034863, partial [Lactarius indigo]
MRVMAIWGGYILAVAGLLAKVLELKPVSRDNRHRRAGPGRRSCVKKRMPDFAVVISPPRHATQKFQKSDPSQHTTLCRRPCLIKHSCGDIKEKVNSEMPETIIFVHPMPLPRTWAARANAVTAS